LGEVFEGWRSRKVARKARFDRQEGSVRAGQDWFHDLAGEDGDCVRGGLGVHGNHGCTRAYLRVPGGGRRESRKFFVRVVLFLYGVHGLFVHVEEEAFDLGICCSREIHFGREDRGRGSIVDLGVCFHGLGGHRD
jgi:hypothetical protein